MSLILNAENISYSVRVKGENKLILNNISFELEKGSLLGISGESGSGKTTLAKILTGIIKPTSGKLNYFFPNKEKIISPVQILFQNTGEIINPLRFVRSMISSLKDIKDDRLGEIIKVVDINKDLLSKRGYELSGGEQQRVALARILAVNPELLILDEPFSAQDFDSQKNFIELFLKLKQELSITIICIAHNLNLLKKLADEVIILYNGEIVEKNKSDLLFNSPQHNYTKFLLKAENYNLTYDDFKMSSR